MFFFFFFLELERGIFEGVGDWAAKKEAGAVIFNFAFVYPPPRGGFFSKGRGWGFWGKGIERVWIWIWLGVINMWGVFNFDHAGGGGRRF